MKKCLMMILLTSLLMPTIYATPMEEPSVQELYSDIDPNLFYPGSLVREFAEKICQEADAMIQMAYRQGKIDGAAQAAVPLLVRIAGLETWKEGAEDKLGCGILKIGLFIVGGFVAGYTIRVIIDK